MPYKNPITQREYQRKWIAKRRAFWVRLLGNKCSKCSSKNKLELDHKNPATKLSHRIWSWRPDKIKLELKKCHLLCRKCHTEKTCIEEYGHKTYAHGTTRSYTTGGCRCLKCKKAKKDYSKKWRELRKK